MTDVTTDGRTVWVNNAACIARFCPISGEVLGPPLMNIVPPIWKTWVDAVKASHGIDVADTYQPGWARMKSRVLLVEDDEDVRQAVARLLRRRYDVTLAADVTEATNILVDDEDFDVIISDLEMPGASGLDLFNIVSLYHARLAPRFILHTGSPSQVKGCGLTVVSKGSDPKLLFKTIEDMLATV